jgi:hypothetical protein
MALPIQPTNTQAGCNPVSSNCVIWQGPDIPCITLCNGDSISDVTFKVATELCDLVKQLDIQFFDVSCFSPICPKPENIHDLIQFILDQLCDLQSGATPAGAAKSLVGSSGVFNCQDSLSCLVPIASCFQYTNQFGNLITEMTLQDYASAIGTRVCSIVNQITILNSAVTDIDTRLAVIEACDPCNPPAPVIEIPSSCLSPSTDIPIVTFVETMEAELCNLQTALVGNGTVAQTVVDEALAQQCQGIEGSAPLSLPYGSMGLIPGWVTASSGNFTTLAAAVQNLWITVCDMRTALQNVVTNCCNVCNQVMLDLSNSSYDPATVTLTVDFQGSIPAGLTAGNLSITITDCNGVFFNYPTGSDIISLMGTSITIDFSTAAPGTFNTGCVGANAYFIQAQTGLNLSTPDGQKCTFAGPTQFVAGGAVPALTITPISTTTLRATFTPTYVGPVTYYLELWNNTTTGIISSTVINNPPTGIAYNHSFGSLTTLTTYQTRMTMVAGSSNETGPFYPGTTL